MKFLKKIVIAVIHFYQRKISPRTAASCRFYPTCSHYALEAVERFGVLRGIWLGTRRILRCNPLFKGGYDPVPQETEKFRF